MCPQQPFCWCSTPPSILSVSRCDVSSLPIFLDCLCILCTPSPLFHAPILLPPSSSPFSSKPHPLPLPTWPSAIQLDAAVAGHTNALRLPRANCSLTLLPLCLCSCSFPPLVSVSLVLAASYPTPLLCFHSDYLPISSSLPLLCPSCASLACRCCSTRLTPHPSLRSLPFLLLLVEIFRAAQHTLAHSTTHSSPAWEKHVSCSGPGPDRMLWEWCGEW